MIQAYTKGCSTISLRLEVSAIQGSILEVVSSWSLSSVKSKWKTILHIQVDQNVISAWLNKATHFAMSDFLQKLVTNFLMYLLPLSFVPELT